MAGNVTVVNYKDRLPPESRPLRATPTKASVRAAATMAIRVGSLLRSIPKKKPSKLRYRAYPDNLIARPRVPQT